MKFSLSMFNQVEIMGKCCLRLVENSLKFKVNALRMPQGDRSGVANDSCIKVIILRMYLTLNIPDVGIWRSC